MSRTKTLQRGFLGWILQSEALLLGVFFREVGDTSAFFCGCIALLQNPKKGTGKLFLNHN